MCPRVSYNSVTAELGSTFEIMSSVFLFYELHQEIKTMFFKDYLIGA